MKKLTAREIPCSAEPLLFDDGLCIGCNRCMNVCQVDIMIPNPVRGKHPVVLYPGECYYCGSCVMECPREGAIRLQHPVMNRAKFVPVKRPELSQTLRNEDTMTVKFKDLAYTRPDEEAVIRGIKEAQAKLTAAADWEAARAAFEAFHRIMESFRSACQIAQIRFTQNVRDPFYEKENEVLGMIAPRVEEAAHDFYGALLSCPYSGQIDREYGPMLLKKLRYKEAGGGEAVTKLLQEENRLMAQFQAVSGTSRIAFRGQVIPAEQLYPYKGDRDRDTRREAYRAEGDYFLQHCEQLEDIFDKLVKNRNAQAQALGFRNYADMSLVFMNRMGYGLEEIAYYREQVKKYWVPAVREIKEMQRKRLGLSELKGYDNLLYFPDYNPAPKGDSQAMLAACSTMFHELSAETGEFFDSLLERDMFDLDSRDGKAPGGYCGSVDSVRSPFIFSNFNGTTRDVDVLIHESGHAFAAYEAYKNGIAAECREASSETCETHSTAMEMLTMPWHQLFFGKDADRYDLFLMERTLTYLPGGCASDEFLTIVYRNPDMTSNERHALWKKLREEYEPHFADFDDIPLYGDGREWLIDPQLFLCPFYLVDYGLARNVSLQLFMLQQKDPELAWEKYLRFVSFGGTKTYMEAVREIGMEIPFEGEAIRRVIEPMLEWVKRQNEKCRAE